MKISELITRIRDKNKWNQTQIANAIGVSQRTISSYEREETYPPYNIVNRIYELAGVENSEDLEVGSSELLKMKEQLIEAQTEARIYKYVFDRIIEKASITIQGDMRGVQEGLGAMVNKRRLASGHT